VFRKGLKKSVRFGSTSLLIGCRLRYKPAFYKVIINTMTLSGYPNGKQVIAEFYRVLKERGKLLIVDFEYPSKRNLFGYWLTKLMESAGDTIRDISKILQEFPFEYIEEGIGGIGSLHFYIPRKLRNT